jgi:hypothetical protein
VALSSISRRHEWSVREVLLRPEGAWRGLKKAGTTPRLPHGRCPVAVQGVSGADPPYLRFERVEGALTRLRGHVPPPLPRQLLVELDVGSKAEAIG